MIGTVLGNRYEILSEIGTGGMAKVYKAKCRYLQRIVAVKILKDEFREDSEFLKRFDTEAQAAASLTHPNIVQIYDVGRDNNRYYIVMEYVEGITLKEYIEERGSLEWREAINISIQICSALSKAHSRHIIHRDIKPHNIMMNSDGVPKVADFGIARSVSNETATMKLDTVGSVHYSSPEQVRGGYTDEKSDIYSIGVTIFEMVTGKLPFDGETPVAVALQHIQDEPPVPSSLKPGIPHALDRIILKAIAKSKQDRYDSVAELINDLENIRLKPGTSHDIVLPNVKRENDKYSTKKFAPLGDEDLKKETPTTAPSKQKNGHNEDNDRDNSGNARRFMMPIIYITLIVAILGGIYYFVNTLLKDLIPDVQERPREVILSNYSGRDIEEVKQELALSGITPEISYEFNDTVGENTVIKQDPLPDTTIKVPGLTPVKLLVSKGQDLVEIPEVVGQDHNTIRFKLQDEYDLEVVEQPEYHEEVAINLVSKIEPIPGTKVARGTKVTVYWSMGPEKKQVVVPNLINSTYNEALKILEEYNLKVGDTFPKDREGFQGKIVDQAPKAGETVTEETAIHLYFQEGDTETGGNVPYPSTGTNQTIVINLPQGYSFGETVRLRAYIFDNSTGDEMEIFDESAVPISEFPRAVTVPVPEGGGITVRVYVNDIIALEKSY